MFGSVSEWFYKSLAGIQPSPDAVGFDHIVIKPQPVSDLQWVRARHRTVRGEVASAWEKTGNQFKLRVTIPANARALVHLPTADPTRVTEGGRPAATTPGVRFVGTERNAAVFSVGSGSYTFIAPIPSCP